MQLRVLPLQDNETFRVSQGPPLAPSLYLLNKCTILPPRVGGRRVHTIYWVNYIYVYMYYNIKQF